MFNALIYLRLTSLKNLLLSRFRRLKQPKYLVGGIVGAAYFYFFFLRRVGGGSSRPMPRLPHGVPGADLPAFDVTPLLATFGGLALLAIAMLAWALPDEKPGLAFTEAEVAFLFPAPITRRRLIHFKVLGSQLRILISALIFTLISSRWSFLDGNAAMHAVGWWVILSAINLHFTGSALTITRLIDGGVSTMWRRTVVFGLVCLAVVVTLAITWRTAPLFTANDGNGPGAFFAYLARLLDGGVLHWLLLPGKWLVAPFLAADAGTFLRALGPALLLLVAHYIWVVRTEVSFEEASATLAEKRATLRAQIRSGTYRIGAGKPAARRGPFPLHDSGRPEIAFLWKNLLSTRPYLRWRTWSVCAMLIAFGVRWVVRQDPSGVIGLSITMVAAVAAAYTLLLGPQLARQDLRSDLPNSDILKTYPLRGWQVLLGELLTPTAILTGLIWLALIAAVFGLTPHGVKFAWFTPSVRFTAGVCAALVAAPLCALQILVPNGAALLFPGWFQATRQRGGGGIDVMGQRLIFGLGQMLAMVLALLPAVAIAGGLIFVTQWLIGLPAAVVFATLAVLVILIGEVWCGLWWLGQRFEKFDLSSELRP